MLRRIGFLLFLLSPVVVQAEATKEFYSEQQAGALLLPEAPNIFTWGGSLTLNSAFNDPSNPEGKGVFEVSKTGAAGQGFGIFANSAQNYSAYSGGALRFWLKGNANSVIVEIEGPAGQKRNVTIASTSSWVEHVIPFSAFSANASFNFSQIIGVGAFTIDQGGTRAIYIDHIRWTKPVTSLAIFPTTATLQQNRNRQFTIEGRDAAGEHVVIYSTFSAAAAQGTFTPVAPGRAVASTFTAAAAGTSGNVTAHLFNTSITTQAAVSIGAGFLRGELGLLSETILPSIVLDTDSQLLKSSGGGGTNPITADESNSDVREGNRRFTTEIPAQGSTGFSGWFIQSNNTRDMSKFYDGSIRFWFKGPSALQNRIEVGIRSENVPAGAEFSKGLLSRYVTFDDTWRSVVIPIRDLAGPRPWADISRTKVLFSIFASSTVSGAAANRTFYIDNLRWDMNTPGALASMAITPSSVTVPMSSIRQFSVRGFDANGVSVDVFPTWTRTPAIGTISPTTGDRTLLTAAASPASGSITATQGVVSTSAIVNVANIAWTQSFNVYSDAGSGGFVGVAKGVNAATDLVLSEQPTGVTGDALTFRRSTFTLVNNSGVQDAFALWFTNYDGGSGSRFMRYFATGYLSFWVRTQHDLQVAVRSANITAGTEQSKFRLSELGIPTNNTWQQVIIPLADFKTREPLLDFDQIQTYFAVGGISAQIGEMTNQVFDIDDVKWLTNDPAVADANKIYVGLKEKQAAGGLVQSFSGSSRAVTYDQAISAMNFTYKKDFADAKEVFDVYKYVHDNYTLPSGAFNGFHDEYALSSAVGGYTVLVSSRTAGPNAFMLLALLHYRHATGQTTYDTVMADIASWLLALQAGDGAIQFGRSGGTLLTNKSTEHNLDVYAAFRAYARFSGNNSYNTSADSILNWLQTEMYIPSQQRFKVGEKIDGTTHNWDRALDAYSWAPLALSSFTNVLATADMDFKNTKTCDLTGVAVTGFDFSGNAVGSGDPGVAADKDAVWIEGTGQMALAYFEADYAALGNTYLLEIEKAVVNTSVNGQGLPYATNNGTAYGFLMDSLNPAASSSAWYLFAKNRFNPFQPYPIAAVELSDIGTGIKRSSMTWTAAPPVRWVRANQKVKLKMQPATTDPWGVQIYTDNTNPGVTPRFVDPTPGVTSNPDSDPAGLLLNLTATTHMKLNLAWSIQDSSATVPVATDPSAGTPPSFQWLYMKDRATPNIPSLNTTAFVDGQDDVLLYRLYGSPQGAHLAQGSSGFFTTNGLDYLYVQADFGSAGAQVPYQTQIIVEFFLQ